MNFIGREKEINRLRAASNSKTSELTAIYGRRRVGKTRLVKEASQKIKLFAFEGLEEVNTAGQKAHFLETLKRISSSDKIRIASSNLDWVELLILLSEEIGNKSCVVFFDEFQWMAAGRNDLVSKLKYVWDNYFREKCNVHLILCGSVSSFIVKKVIHSKALYGRINHIIHLQPLSFPEVRHGFFKERSTLEALEYYLIAGGIPKYLEMMDVKKSVRLNVLQHGFMRNGYFLDERDRMFASHFGKYAKYIQIAEFLSNKGFGTRDEIVKSIGRGTGGRVSEYLANLESAGFIESYHPIQSTSSYLMRYRIADPYLRFYDNFIKPIKNRINKDMAPIPYHQALPENRYAIFLGLSFERFCYQHASLIAKCLGFSSVAYKYGAYYNKSDANTGVQIDLVFDRADKVITLCEVKFKKNVGKEVIRVVEAKKNRLADAFKNYSIETVLISAYPPQTGVIGEGYFSHVLTAEDFGNPFPHHFYAELG